MLNTFALNNLGNFLFELGVLRKIIRSHSQNLFTNDFSDNISSHSFRVTIIAFFLSKMEKADIEKVLIMSLLHDIAETRSGDQSWVHKRYVKVDEERIIQDQISPLPFADFLKNILKEYNIRKSKESLIAKDADLIDQILLLKEYAMQGNSEAQLWLKGKDSKGNAQYKLLKTKSGKLLAKRLLRLNPSDWWNSLSTSKRV